MSYTDKEREFLKKLTALTRETGIAIGGCGCCGSPFLIELDKDSISEEEGYGESDNKDVFWVSKSDEYDWKHSSDTIVR